MNLFSSINTVNLKRGWASAVSGLNDVNSFDECFEQVKNYLKEVLDEE